MRRICKFLSHTLIAICFACTATHTVLAASNMSVGDVGDFGTWATDNARETIVKNMTSDISNFQESFQTQLVDDYVPIEAKVGLAFMNSLTWIGDILDNSLIHFVNIFILVMFIFWIMFESYNLIQGKAQVRPTIKNITKKAFLIIIWTIIMEQGPAQIFMWIMGPILRLGSMMSNMILDAVATGAGTHIPDTCTAIREYTTAHISPAALIDANSVSDILCVPSRLSGFFYTAVAAGWKWILVGIGTSVFTVLAGIIFIVMFTINIWKFALMALGVIADLFLAILMLPFTAIAETVSATTYQGIAGNIYNGFIKIFNVESLTKQIERFVNAAIYFVSLSIVIAICAAILSGTLSTDLSASVPSIDNAGFMITLLTGALVMHLANRADEIAKKIGGSVNSALGGQVGNAIKTLWNETTDTVQKWWKLYRGNN